MVMDRIIQNLLDRTNAQISQEDIEQMRQEAIDQLNDQYPELGVQQQ